MDHDRRDDRTLATRRATGILPVAVSPSERKQTTKVMYAGVAAPTSSAARLDA
jgi:hypothetical protein